MNVKEIRERVADFYNREDKWRSMGRSRVDTDMIDKNYLIVGKDVLDLGCHYPEAEMRWASRAKSWVAIDILPFVIERCKEMCPNVTFKVMDIVSLDFPDESFDVVLDLSSGDHLAESDYDKAINEVHRVLRKNGYFVIAYSSLNHFKESYNLTHGFSKAYSRDEMTTKLMNSGFYDFVYYDEIVEGRVGITCKKK